MVVLKVEIDNLDVLPVDAKRDAPILRDRKTPHTLAAAFQRSRLPAWNGAQFILALHVLQEQDNAKDFVGNDGGHARPIIPLDQVPQSLVNGIANAHGRTIAAISSCVK
jgi:hypothetical protein